MMHAFLCAPVTSAHDSEPERQNEQKIRTIFQVAGLRQSRMRQKNGKMEKFSDPGLAVPRTSDVSDAVFEVWLG